MSQGQPVIYGMPISVGFHLPHEHLLLMANQQYPLRQVSYDG